MAASSGLLLIGWSSIYMYMYMYIYADYRRCLSESAVATLFRDGQGNFDFAIVEYWPNTLLIWKKALHRDLYHLAWHYDTNKSTFKYAKGKKNSAKNSSFLFLLPLSHINLLISIVHQPKQFLS